MGTVRDRIKGSSRHITKYTNACTRKTANPPPGRVAVSEYATIQTQPKSGSLRRLSRLIPVRECSYPQIQYFGRLSVKQVAAWHKWLVTRIGSLREFGNTMRELHGVFDLPPAGLSSLKRWLFVFDKFHMVDADDQLSWTDDVDLDFLRSSGILLEFETEKWMEAHFNANAAQGTASGDDFLHSLEPGTIPGSVSLEGRRSFGCNRPLCGQEA